MKHPHTTHRGYFAECYNDIRKTTKRRTVEDIVLTGHLQYLRTIKCNRDAKHIERLTQLFHDGCEHHYCLPDNVHDFVSEAECDEHSKNKGLDLWPHDVFTVSHRHPTGLDIMMMFLNIEGDDHRVLWLQRVNSDMDEAVIQAASELNVQAGMQRWVAPSHCMDLSNGGYAAREWMLERREKDLEFRTSEQANHALVVSFDTTMKFLTLLNRPDQVLEAFEPADFVPAKKNKGQIKRGEVRDKQPTFFRIYKPKTRWTAPEGHVPSETGVKQLEHTRKAHTRRYKSGLVIEIPAYTAGDPSLGSTVGKPKTIEVMPELRGRKKPE